MEIVHNLVPVNENSLTEDGNASFFTVKHCFGICEKEETKLFQISPHNIIELEKDKNTPKSILTVIAGIWDTLSIENCYVTPEVLRLVFDFEKVLKEEGTFTQFIARRCGNDPDKAALLTMNMACELLLPCKTKDFLEYFIKSKLGILLLRDMVNIKTSTCLTKRTKRPSLASSVVKALDRQYLESPISSCYVKNITLEVLELKNKARYVRTRPRYQFGTNSLFQTASADLPTREQFDMVNGRDLNFAMYTYGEIMACMLSHVGDFCASDEEFQKKKQLIEQKWTDRANFATNAGQTFVKPKWYDSYAGTKELSAGKYKLILTEVPSHMSVFSTLSAMKRNLITFLYMALVFKEFSTETANKQEATHLESDLKFMGQKFPRYFINTESLSAAYKTPLKIPKTKRSPYMKLEELVFYNKSSSGSIGSHLLGRKKLSNKGMALDLIENIKRVEEIENKMYKHVDVLNVYSKLSLTEKERQALGNDMVDKNSLVLVPMTLGSYLDLNEIGSNVKFISGIQSRIGYQETPLWIAKSSLLYEKCNQDSECTLSSGKRIREDEVKADAKELVYTLMKSGHTMEEACNMVSLCPAEMDDFVCEEPLSKKRTVDLE